ncbi:inositol-3-phosphate synthase 1 [Striga asiatica]|uniref:Inositol-3-phosphate synthase 1 n=1 Tax=Striga asiatica TaxID=4170 RepID=A0A5A7PW31_STRAF|nr:inositol-3-phosphate synthase 1 [Striga asiatica]
MVYGLTVMGFELATCLGFNEGIAPLGPTNSGFPLSKTVRLCNFLSIGLKWYSSLYSRTRLGTNEKTFVLIMVSGLRFIRSKKLKRKVLVIPSRPLLYTPPDSPIQETVFVGDSLRRLCICLNTSAASSRTVAFRILFLRFSSYPKK